MAEAEGGSEQDDVSFLRTVRSLIRIKFDKFELSKCQNFRKIWFACPVQQPAKECV